MKRISKSGTKTAEEKRKRLEEIHGNCLTLSAEDTTRMEPDLCVNPRNDPKPKTYSASKILRDEAVCISVDENNIKFATCKLCTCPTKPIKMANGNTTGVKRHLERYHPEQYVAIYGEASKKVHITDLFPCVKYYYIFPTKYKRYSKPSFFSKLFTASLGWLFQY